jgi:23S rRNA (uridine2552-2'-O)-methyltransferase
MAYQLKDTFYRKAKREGYRSRAAYKLLELNRRFDLIKDGDRVVDLGAAPGGWLQVAAKLIGPRGKAIGVDIQPIESFTQRNINIFVFQGDISSEQSQAKIKELLGSPADCVLSDLSPRLTGIHDVDVSRSLELVRLASKVARQLLRPGGHFLAKTFQGAETGAIGAELREYFDAVKQTRPEATRKGSSEIYFVAKGFNGRS